MTAVNQSYIFVDESGDPGKPYKVDRSGNKIPTGASMFYILSALPLSSDSLFLLEDKIMEAKNRFGYRKEIKSDDISLPLYKSLLGVLNKLNIKVFYRLVNKATYKGKFAVDGNRKLHNVFDEYNLVKLVSFAIEKCGFLNAEVVIDRAERRLLDGRFDNFNNYLMNKVNTKTIKRVSWVTHVDSKYVNAMQMTDLISGMLKDHFTKRNVDLKKVVDERLLSKVW